MGLPGSSFARRSAIAMRLSIRQTCSTSPRNSPTCVVRPRSSPGWQRIVERRLGIVFCGHEALGLGTFAQQELTEGAQLWLPQLALRVDEVVATIVTHRQMERDHPPAAREILPDKGDRGYRDAGAVDRGLVAEIGIFEAQPAVDGDP